MKGADNFFTSEKVARTLFKNNTGFIGTIRSNKNEVPDAFLPTEEREIYSSEFAFNEFLTLVSYCPKIKVYF